MVSITVEWVQMSAKHFVALTRGGGIMWNRDAMLRVAQFSDLQKAPSIPKL